MGSISCQGTKITLAYAMWYDQKKPIFFKLKENLKKKSRNLFKKKKTSSKSPVALMDVKGWAVGAGLVCVSHTDTVSSLGVKVFF